MIFKEIGEWLNNKNLNQSKIKLCQKGNFKEIVYINQIIFNQKVKEDKAISLVMKLKLEANFKVSQVTQETLMLKEE